MVRSALSVSSRPLCGEESADQVVVEPGMLSMGSFAVRVPGLLVELVLEKIIATQVISSNDFLPTIVLQSPHNNDFGVFVNFSKTTPFLFKIFVLRIFVRIIMKSLFKCVKSLLCLV